MNKKNTISLGSIIAAVAIFFIGYLVGRGYADTIEVEKEVVKWKTEQLPPIHDTIPQSVPYLVENTDTVYKIIEHTLEVDTLAILADYYRVRNYDLDFSNDSVGIFKVNLDITKNALANARSEIRPIRNTVETIRAINNIKAIQLYSILGSSVDLKTNKIQFGVDLRQKYLIGVSGIRMDDRYGYTIDLGMKF